MPTATALAGTYAGGVCVLMKRYIEGSPRYVALSPSGRAAADRFAAELCARAGAIAAGPAPAGKAKLRLRYGDALTGAIEEGWLTPGQAATLRAAAATL
jgi:hypothetical protein